MKMIMRILAVVAAVAMLAPAAMAADQLQIEGSTTVGPIADAFVNAFQKKYPDVKFTVKKTGSGDGAAALIDGRCDIAAMSRFMKDGEFKKAVDKGITPVAHAIAMDGVCVVVHPSNPVSALTTEQIRSIYKGEIKNWKQVGGADMPIVVISRDTSSGTYETFHKLAMKKEKMGGGTEYVNSNPQAHKRVSTTKGAVAYVGLGFLDEKVKGLKVDGIMASKQTVASGKYPISRPLFLFTNGYPKLGSMVFEFCTYHLTEDGQELIGQKGFVPVTNY
ncbi:MAG: phosphate ABC transporter substrate-binding protein PstS family protein [Planctomycetes bacterium]|jgi:phosphate transport system substrate-binding protein|nr:phosphate ABC transporter substrate-binding protein [Phycisphaerae bacterium]NBB95922.1 phosphate ABC transporter substrate-binding protein PstS family protein [Planctomycetota bacterium]